MIKSALMTSAAQGVVKEDGVDAGRSVRRRRRLDPRRPRGQPDARLRRDLRRLRRLGDRSAPPDRPQHRERRRDDDDRARSRPSGRRPTSPARSRTSRSRPTRRPARTIFVSDKAPGPNGPKARQHDPPEEERDDRHLDHDQRSGARERAVLRPDHARSEGRHGAQRRHDPGRVLQAAGRRHADARLHADDVPRRRRASRTARRPSPTSAASRRNVNLTVTNLDKGKLDFTNIVGAGDGDQEGRRRPVERHADAGGPAARSTRSRTSPATGPTAATCRCRCSASGRSRVSATTRSRTSTCRRSTTAASRTRGSASCRTATS